MGKIRSMMLGAALLLVLLLCTACGAKQMPVNVIETAILEKDDVYSAYGLEEPYFRVGDGNYDRTYKTEDVTVEVYAESAESNYIATYDVIGSYQNGTWTVTSVIKTDENIWPQKVISSEVAEPEIEAILQKEENRRYQLRLAGVGHSNKLAQNMSIDVQLSYDTPDIYMFRDYKLFYEYTLDGWKFTGQTEGNIQIDTTDGS